MKRAEEFHKDKTRRDGLQNKCKACASEASRSWYAENQEWAAERSRRWRAENRERHAERSRRWCAANRERRAENYRQWYAENRERRAESVRRWRLETQYGITPEEFDALLAQQGGACAICGRTEPNGRGWCVDHCHDSNEVRGILCSTCNTGIGHLGDTYAAVARAALYLHRAEERFGHS